MRKEFVECVSARTAIRRCPWAAKVIKTEGGYMCFESVDDYYVWLRQQ